MLRTSKCPSSGRLVHAGLCYFMHPYDQSGQWQDVLDTAVCNKSGAAFASPKRPFWSICSSCTRILSFSKHLEELWSPLHFVSLVKGSEREASHCHSYS
jgi:hypothetical protein